MKKKDVWKSLYFYAFGFGAGKMVGLGLVLGLVGLGAALGLLAVSGWFITAAGIAAVNLAALHAFNFLQPGALIRFLAIIRTAALYGERIVSHDGILRLLEHLRLRLFDRLALTDRFHLAGLGSGNLMQGMLSDIDLLDQWPLKGLAPWTWALALNLVLLGFLLFFAPGMVTVFAGFLGVVFGIMPLCAPWRNIRLAGQKTEQAALRRQFLLESFSGLLTLKTTGAFNDHFQKMQELDRDVLETGWKLSRFHALLQTLISLALFVLLWFLIAKGAKLASGSALEVAILAGLVCAVLGMTEIMLPLSRTFQTLGFTLKAGERLQALAGNPDEKKESKFLAKGNLTLEVNGLSVRQGQALTGPENVSFVLARKDILWVSGASGCGKSTLALALSGWLAPERGEIRLCNVPLAEIPEKELRRLTGLLDQKPHLFSLSLNENLRLANPDVPEKELWEILDLVFLGDWARSLPLGLETPIGEYGHGLSGGQARRLALARLLLFSPEILILDEPFEGLDEKMAAALLQALVKRQEKGILIVISHQKGLQDILPENFKQYSFT